MRKVTRFENKKEKFKMSYSSVEGAAKDILSITAKMILDQIFQ